jgi:hypothetical protein
MGIIRKRYSKTRMSSMRRQHSAILSIFNAYYEFKVRLKYGRRKTIHWWRKNV